MFISHTRCIDSRASFDRTWCSCISQMHYHYLSWAINLPVALCHHRSGLFLSKKVPDIQPAPVHASCIPRSDLASRPSIRAELEMDSYIRHWATILDQTGADVEVLRRTFTSDVANQCSCEYISTLPHQRPRTSYLLPNSCASDVFGAPLGSTALTASVVNTVHGRHLELPAVIFDCVEHLVYSRKSFHINFNFYRRD